MLPRGLTQSTISNRLRVPLTGMTAHKKACPGFVSYQVLVSYCTGHNLTGIASQFAMHLGFTGDVISVTHRSD